MTSPTLSFLSLLFLRLFLSLVFFLCAGLVGQGIVSLRQAKKSGLDRARWLGFVIFFSLAGGLAYYQLVAPNDHLRVLTDTARPQQIRLVRPEGGRGLVFWETTEPVSGLVRYGYSPDSMVYLARSEKEDSRWHRATLTEPIPETGIWATIYSGGRAYTHRDGTPFLLQ